MKILLTSLLFAPSIGGIETVSMLLAREFVAAGHSVKVATMTPEDSSTSYEFEVLREPSFAQLAEAARWCDRFTFKAISACRSRRRFWSFAGLGSSFITPGFPRQASITG